MDDGSTLLLRITAPHFVCGVVLVADQVTTWAPIVKYMRGWREIKVRQYARQKGWTIEDYQFSESLLK